MERDSDPVLPLVLGQVSNGEFLPAAAGAADIRLARAVLERATSAADALAMDRRLFLQTAGGMAALLTMINLAACTSQSRPSASPTRKPSGKPGGSYEVPPPEQLPECRAALGSRGEFIVDVHTHHVMPSLPWRRTAPATLRLVLDMVPADCTAANPLTCVDRAAYLHDMFLASDTTVALLSDLPSTGKSSDPLPFGEADGTWQLASSLTHGGASRLLLQNVVAPNLGPLSARLDGMTQTATPRSIPIYAVDRG